MSQETASREVRKVKSDRATGQLRAARNEIAELKAQVAEVERELVEARGEKVLASAEHEEELADLRGEVEELTGENGRLADIVAHPGGDNGCGDVFDLGGAEGDLKGIVDEAAGLVKMAGQRKDDWLGIEVARGADEIRRVAAGLLCEVEGLLGRGGASGGGASTQSREDAKEREEEGGGEKEEGEEEREEEKKEGE